MAYNHQGSGNEEQKQQGTSKPDKKSDDNYMSIGMLWGMCIGMTVGKLVFDNLSTGMSVGMCLGLAIGASVKKKK